MPDRISKDEANVRGYFPCCPICGSSEIKVHLVSYFGRDTLSCSGCGALWHINVGLTGLRSAELKVEADNGKGEELLNKLFTAYEWQRMAQQTRKTLPIANQPSRTRDTIDVAAKEKEIVREKEVIVKIRCRYCHNRYDETLDKCPHCGAKD